MNVPDTFRYAMVAAGMVGASFAWVTPCYAIEPASKFLEQLRNRGYFDMAEAYLQRMANSPLVDSEFKQSITLERALASVQLATRQSDPAQRMAGLDQANSLFREFLANQPNHPKSREAISWVGRIVLEQARLTTARANDATDKAERQKLRGQANSLLNEAEKAFADQVARIRGEIESFRQRPKDQQDVSTRDELRVEYLQASMVVAEIAYEKADTFEGTQRKKQLQKAAEGFALLTEKYRQKLVGLQAMVLEGKCYQDLGQYQKALALYQDFIGPDSANGPLRKLSGQAVLYSMQCHSTDGTNQLDTAVSMGEAWLEAAGGTRAEPPEVQDVRLQLAKILVEKAKLAERPADANALLVKARKQISKVVRRAGPRQAVARKLMAELPGSTVSDDVPETANSYEAAKLAAEQSRESMQSSEMATRILQGRLANTRIVAERESMRQEVEKTRQESAGHRATSLKFYRQTLRMAPRDLPIDELNRLRFFVAYLSFGSDNFFDAATLGEFLAYQFPESEVARNAGSIAMASYLRIYGDGTDSRSAEFASRRVIGIADYLARTWPDKKEAQDALITLVSFMVNRGDLEKAQTYLEKIPVDSPRRAEAELRTGQALWANYVKQSRMPATDRPAAMGELDALKVRAEQTLAKGIDRMRQSEKSLTLVQAALSLAQIYVDMEQPDKAITLLRDAEIGPLALVEAGDPLTTNPGFDAAIFKTALRAEFARMAKPATADSAMTSARKLMDQLESAMGDSDAGRKRLVSTYVSLASDMESQLAIASSESKKSLAQGFEVFLDQVGSTSKQFNVLNWVAETYYSLGQSFQVAGEPPNNTAGQYFRRASKMYQTILASAEDKELSITENQAIQLRMRRASTMTQLGDYEQAIEEFVAILSRKNNMLNLQIEAAESLEEGGIAGKTELLKEAVSGGRRNNNTGKNTIWGWSQIARISQAQMRQSDEKRQKYAPYFFDAQWHVARCRHEQAKRADGEQRTKFLQSAKRTISFTSASYPKLGGAERRQQFDDLLKEVQEALGEPTVGLGTAPPPADN